MGLFNLAETRLSDLEARVAALEGTVIPTPTPPVAAITSLQAAIDATPAGGELVVPAGSYSPVVIPRAMTIRGPLDAVIDGGDVAVKPCSGLQWYGFTWKNQATAGMYRDAALENILVDGTHGDNFGDFMIHLSGGWKNVTFRNLTGANAKGTHYPSHILYLKTGSGFAIEDCDLGRCYGPGGEVGCIQIGYGVSNGQILRNRVHDSPYGIIIWGNSSGATHDIVCSGNVGSNNGTDFYEYGANIQNITWDAGTKVVRAQ